MTIVEVVDQYGGFNFVRDTLKTQSKRGLLWRVVALTFILSAILDNMTTTIVMIMVLRKLVRDHSDRIIYASLIILAANAGLLAHRRRDDHHAVERGKHHGSRCH